MAELDWQKPEDYAYLGDYNLHEWAWEFLRRNPLYREAYFALEAMAKRGILQEIEEDRAKRAVFWGLHYAATEPWGLRLPANPRYPFRQEPIFFTERAGVALPTAWKAPDPGEGDLWPGYAATLVLKFDLHYSVETLIEIASEQLRQCARHIRERFPDYEPLAPKKVRFHRSNFPLYVRLLDSDLAGATNAQVISVLFTGHLGDPRRSMTKARETARRMAAEDYRDLLLLPPRQSDF